MNYESMTQDQLCKEFNRITDICIAEYALQDKETKKMYTEMEYLMNDKQRSRIAKFMAINYIDSIKELKEWVEEDKS